MVDFGVDGGRLELLVAQHLRDLWQRGARPEHLGRGGVTQPVRPGWRHAGTSTRRVHDPAHPAPGQRPSWRQHLHEHRARLSPRAVLQVGRERLADVDGDGHSILQSYVTALRIRW